MLFSAVCASFIRAQDAQHQGSRILGNDYLWKTDSQTNHVAQVRYARGHELTDIPGVTGIGIGKDHIILYVSDDSVEVPAQVEDVLIVKVRRL